MKNGREESKKLGEMNETDATPGEGCHMVEDIYGETGREMPARMRREKSEA